MKQKINGKKVINWHQPRPKGNSKTEYLKKRVEDPDYEYFIKNQSLKEEDYQDYEDYDYLEDFEATNDTITRNKLISFVENLLFYRNPININSKILQSVDKKTCASNVSNIEIKLDEYIRCSIPENNCLDLMKIKIQSHLLKEAENTETLAELYSDQKTKRLVQRICILSPFWVRTPDSWDKNCGISIVDHLFHIYEVPTFLKKCWSDKNSEIFTKYVFWSIIIGQGGSIQKAAKVFNWNISPRFLHNLYNIDENLTPLESIVFAEVLRKNGTKKDFQRISSCAPFMIDPTEPIKNEFIKFWQESVSWIIKFSDKINDSQSLHILEWASHMFSESEREYHIDNLLSDGPEIKIDFFSMNGRSLKRTLERSQQYQKDLELPWSNEKWNSHNVNWEYTENETAWKFKELTNGLELYQEGSNMNHCVSLYVKKCYRGESAIISLLKNQKRALTIELNPRGLYIIQAKGFGNRNIKSEEQYIINKWLDSIKESTPEIT